MKWISALLTGLLISLTGISQPAVTNALVPQYMAMETTRTPFAFKLTIGGLTPNATYRFYNKFTDCPFCGYADGHCTLIASSGTFTRVASPSMSVTGRYGEFTADASGNYTGWFVGEPESTIWYFYPGSIAYVVLFLNNGAGGNIEEHTLYVDTDPITILGTDQVSAPLGTAIRSTPAAEGVEKNFVMLYDNTAGTGRPVAGTFIESDGNANTVAGGYADFYSTSVDNVAKAWGTFIPNDLPNGIQKIVQYGRNGLEVGSRIAASGTWAQEGGGRVSTISPNGGSTNVILLNGNVVRLGSPDKYDQTITFNAISKQYGDADFDPGATTNSELEITYTSSNPAVAAIVNGQIHIVGAGTSNITAKQSGDEDFNPATDVTRLLTVSKAPLAIKAHDKQMVSGDPLPQWTADYTGFVNGDDASDLNPQPAFSTNAPLPTPPAGTYNITPGGAGSPNYEITYEPGELTVTSNKQPQTITFGTITPKVYGAVDFNPGATSSSGLIPRYQSSNPSVAAIVNNVIHITGVGSTDIMAYHLGDANYEPSDTVTRTLVVNKAPLTITADNKAKLEGHVNPALTITYAGFVYGETRAVLITQPSISTTATTTSSAGDYVITVTGATAANYNITHENGTLTVQPLPSQTISFSDLPVKNYGDDPFPTKANASSGLKISYSSSNQAVAIVERDTILIRGAGTTQITASQPGDAFNAPATDVTKTLIIKKGLLTIRAEDKSKAEGAAVPSLTVAYSGFVYSDDESVLTTAPVLSTTVTSSTLIGVYPINISGAVASNYNLLLLPGKLTVMPAQGGNQNSMTAFCSSPDQLQVNVYADTAQKGAVQLFDPSGNMLLNVPVSIGKGPNIFRLPIGNVASGIYYVRVAAAHFTRKDKVRIP